MINTVYLLLLLYVISLNHQIIKHRGKGFAIDQKGLKQYEVAHELGISHITFCIWLRYELPEDKKKRIMSVIDSMK